MSNPCPRAGYGADAGGPKCADVRLVPAAAPDGIAATELTRCVVDPVLFSALSDFAHRTYAPATEESPLAGAGAGLNDND